MKKNIVLITQLDGTATEDRTDHLKIELKKYGNITILDTRRLIRKYLLTNLFFLPTKIFLAFFLNFCLYKLSFKRYPTIQVLPLRAAILKRIIKAYNPDVVICGVEEDMMVTQEKIDGVKLIIYDMPTPYVAELMYGGGYTSSEIKKLEKIERDSIKAADFFCTNWYGYTKYLQKKYGVNNSLFAVSGCEKTKKFARFSLSPKIAFVGNLEGYWANVPLLKKLHLNSKSEISVFSPQKKLANGLNYKGYLSDHDQLVNFQFGLITISDDPLRRIGFSAKHLLYISYGLPVLCPEWRRDPLLEPATIYYNEANFNQQVKKFQKKKNWLIKHYEAKKLAKKLYWSSMLEPIINEVKKVTS